MARKQGDNEPYRNFDKFMAVEDALCDDVEVFDLPFSGFKWKVHSTVKSNPSGLETRGREPWLGERFTYSSLERTSGNAKASCEHIPTHDTLYTHYARQLQMGKLAVRPGCRLVVLPLTPRCPILSYPGAETEAP